MVYIGDCTRVRAVSRSSGIITTVAGSAGSPGSTDGSGAAIDAQLSERISGLAVDTSGNIYIADSSRIRVIIETNEFSYISQLAGGSFSRSSLDVGVGGWANDFQFGRYPSGLAVDNSGNVYVLSFPRILRITNGVVVSFAGSDSSGSSGDGGAATSAMLGAALSDDEDRIYPSGIAVDSLGNVFVADASNFRIRVVNVTALSYPGTIPIASNCPTGMYAYPPAPCMMCPAGSYAARTGATICTSCPAGQVFDFNCHLTRRTSRDLIWCRQFSNPGATACQACAA